MANRKLNSIKFPDIADTYILDADKVNYDGSETYASGSVGEALQNKANIDGSYEGMTVGNAEQLVSNVRVNDKTPYLFRTSGGSVDIGDREYINGIVGGTVAFNQLGRYGGRRGTRPCFSAVDSAVVSETSTSMTVNTANASYWNNIPSGHKILLTADMSQLADSTNDMQVNFGGDIKGTGVKLGTTVKHIAVIGQMNGASYTDIYFYPNGVSGGFVANWTIANLQIFDLTQMFGSAIADYIYSLETANAGAGAAFFKKLFNKPYYAYNAGELKSVSGLVSHDMTGFNQWDEEWEVGAFNTTTGENTNSPRQIRSKNYIDMIGGQSYYFSTPTLTGSGQGMWVIFFDASKNVISGYVPPQTVDTYQNAYRPQNKVMTIPPNARYAKFYLTSEYGTTYKNDTCINIAWDNSRNGEYEPYELHSYPLDSTLTLRGIPKLDANNNLYYDGDVYESDGTVNRRYGEVTITTVTDVYGSAVNGWQRFSVVASGANWVSNATAVKAIATIGLGISADALAVKHAEGSISSVMWAWASSKNQLIIDLPVATTSEAETWLANNTFKVVYELATPTTETADPYQTPQIVNDFGTEEFVIDSNTFAVPVGHDTEYPVNLVAKLEMAPNSPEGDGDYIVRQTNGTNEYVPLVIEDALPQIPSTAGTYKLTVTVASGSDPVLSWEAE